MLGTLRNIGTRIRYLKNWYRFIYPFNTFPATARLRSGLSFRVASGHDLATVLEIAGADAYRVRDISIADVHTVVDAGAHIGTFAIPVAKRFPGARVYAIEPDPDNTRALRENIAANAVTNVFVVEAALSSRPGTATLYSSDDPSRSMRHSLSPETFGAHRARPILLVTLDAYDPIDILKVDIEGIAHTILPHDCRYLLLDAKGEDPSIIPPDARYLGRKIYARG